MVQTGEKKITENGGIEGREVKSMTQKSNIYKVEKTEEKTKEGKGVKLLESGGKDDPGEVKRNYHSR